MTVYAITSTVSGNGDQSADPNKLVTITDSLSATSLPTGEIFTTVRAAGNLEVLRGVSFTPARSYRSLMPRRSAGSDCGAGAILLLDVRRSAWGCPHAVPGTRRLGGDEVFQ